MASEERDGKQNDNIMMMSMEDDGDHSGSSGCGRSMVSFEIALQEGDLGEPTTTWETCLLDKKHRSDDDADDDADIDDVLVRKKYPWRSFKAAFLRSRTRLLTSDATTRSKIVVVFFVFCISFVTLLAVVSSTASSRQQQQQQQQQQVQALNFAGQDRHVIEHDYFSSTADREYISDSAPIGHKCLFVCFFLSGSIIVVRQRMKLHGLCFFCMLWKKIL